MVKLPYPYAIAAEFVLFREWAKVTLPHLLVPLAAAVVLPVCFMMVRVKLGFGLMPAALLALLAAVVTGFVVFRLFCLVLPALRMLVRLGVVALPNRQRLRAKIRSYCGAPVS